jgi:nitrate/TMAO reductase-like tetraheme cytochrome c subunit
MGRKGQWLILCLVAATWSEIAYAQDPIAAIHDFQRDPVEEWLSRILVALLIISIPIVLYSAIRYRGQLVGRASWALLIAGTVALPAISLTFGTLVVFERAEKNEFCASCHLAMQVYIDDMEDPDSESLAAVHYKNRYIPANQCYDCHTSAGLFGTVEAKMKGITDLYKYYTDTYAFPIEMRHPYPNGDCLKCHARSAKWLSQELHTENQDALFSDDVVCLDCHGEMGHPAHILPENAPTEAD